MTRISLEEIFRRAVDIVESQRITYLVYGGIALPFWGRVSPTEDVDLVVHVTESEAASLIVALRRGGWYNHTPRGQ